MGIRTKPDFAFWDLIDRLSPPGFLPGGLLPGGLLPSELLRLAVVFHVAGLDDRGLGVVGLPGLGIFPVFLFHIHPSKTSIPRNVGFILPGGL